jgi:hypothetical protein
LRATQEVVAFQRLVDFNQDLQRMRASNAGSEEWTAFSQRVRARLTQYLERQRDADTTSSVDQLLMGASTSFLMILDEDPLSTKYDAELFNALSSAGRILENETGMVIEDPPAPQAVPEDE